MSQYLYGLLAALVIPIIGIFAASYAGYIPQIKPLVVLSGSMEPAIKTGSVVFIQKSQDYNQGDIIAFSQGGKNLVTHRLVSVHLQGVPKEAVFQTKGDANEESDRTQVQKDQIAGKVILYIPGIGFGVDLVKHPKGFILLVIIPATIIIYEELKTIRAELSKFFTRLSPISTSGAPKLMVVFPLLGLSLLLITVSASYFLDEEKALSNIMGAAASFTDQVDQSGQLVSPQEASQSASPSAQPTP